MPSAFKLRARSLKKTGIGISFAALDGKEDGGQDTAAGGASANRARHRSQSVLRGAAASRTGSLASLQHPSVLASPRPRLLQCHSLNLSTHRSMMCPMHSTSPHGAVRRGRVWHGVAWRRVAGHGAAHGRRFGLNVSYYVSCCIIPHHDIILSHIVIP